MSFIIPSHWGTATGTCEGEVVDSRARRLPYHLRFLWRLAREAFRRLCLLILVLRRFFNDPILLFLQLRSVNIPLYSVGIQ